MRYKNTLTFKLESPDGDAVITCRGLSRKASAKFRAALRLDKEKDSGLLLEATESILDEVCKSVISCEGLEYEDGSEIPLEDIREGLIDDKLSQLIFSAFMVAFAAKEEVSEEKKSTAAESSKDSKNS